jgi:hypothetical protein
MNDLMQKWNDISTEKKAGAGLGLLAVVGLAVVFWPKKAAAAEPPPLTGQAPTLPPCPASAPFRRADGTCSSVEYTFPTGTYDIVLVDGYDDPPTWPIPPTDFAAYKAKLGQAWSLSTPAHWGQAVGTLTEASAALEALLKVPSEVPSAGTWANSNYVRPKSGMLVDANGIIQTYLSSKPYRQHFVVAVFSIDGSDPPPLTRDAQGNVNEWYDGYMLRINAGGAKFASSVDGPFAGAELTVAKAEALSPGSALAKQYGAPRMVFVVDEYGKIVELVACTPASC